MHEHDSKLEQLSAAAQAWEMGDHRRARAALAGLDPSQLDPEQRRVHDKIAHGLALDPAILATGLVLVGLWLWVFLSVAPG